MKKKLIATLAVAAVLALAPLCVDNTALIASASSNSTASSNDTTEEAEQTEETTGTGVETEETEETEQATETTYEDYLAEVESNIAAASASATVSGTTVTYEITVGGNDGFAMPNSMMQALVAAGNVDFTVHFTYDGVEYTITIPAGEAVDDSTPWYGPLYLNKYFGSATGTSVSGSTYTVVSGDTMSAIAKANGLTLSRLAALNAQVTDINLIYPGQLINLN